MCLSVFHNVPHCPPDVPTSKREEIAELSPNVPHGIIDVPNCPVALQSTSGGIGEAGRHPFEFTFYIEVL